MLYNLKKCFLIITFLLCNWQINTQIEDKIDEFDDVSTKTVSFKERSPNIFQRGLNFLGLRDKDKDIEKEVQLYDKTSSPSEIRNLETTIEQYTPSKPESSSSRLFPKSLDISDEEYDQFVANDQKKTRQAKKITPYIPEQQQNESDEQYEERLKKSIEDGKNQRSKKKSQSFNPEIAPSDPNSIKKIAEEWRNKPAQKKTALKNQNNNFFSKK